MGINLNQAITQKGIFSKDKQAEWQMVARLLHENQYEQTARLLSDFQIPENNHDSHLAPILETVQQICLVCQQVQAEIELHQQAYHNAVQRERELQQQLTLILDLVEQHWEPGDLLSGSNSQKQPPNTENGRSWWQQLRTWLGLNSTKTNTEMEPPVPDNTDEVEETAVPPPISPPEIQESLPVEAPEQVDRETAVFPLQIEPLPQKNTPSLAVYCLGRFRVHEDDQPVEEWSNGKGKSIFKYLITHRQHPVNKEVLMDLFWPDASPDAARNNLNVAIYSLRQALRNGHADFSHVLFQSDTYSLNPELQIWVDTKEFEERIQAAQKLADQGNVATAVLEYHAAEELYHGDFLAEDRYEEWLMPQRQYFQDAYLDLLDYLCSYYYDTQDYAACVTLGRKMLAIEPCREDAHRRLMRSYCQQKQHYLALRQYHECVEALKEELDVAPDPLTAQLYERIRLRKPV